jgi:hypothetical protein
MGTVNTALLCGVNVTTLGATCNVNQTGSLVGVSTAAILIRSSVKKRSVPRGIELLYIPNRSCVFLHKAALLMRGQGGAECVTCQVPVKAVTWSDNVMQIVPETDSERETFSIV